MITMDNYLAFADILIYEVVGGVWLAYLIGVSLLLYKSIEWRIPFQVMVILFIITSLAYISYVYDALVLMIVIMVVGLVFYGIYSKVIRH